MKRATVILTLLGGAWASTAHATSYTINGYLDDWGVTPFVHWAPAGAAVYTQTNNVNEYNAVGYEECFDFEALYVDRDTTNLYIAAVTSHPLKDDPSAGDLGIDLNDDMTISPHGIVTGLEYALRIGSDFPGQVVADPVWSSTDFHNWPGEGWQGSPYRAVDGTVVGSVFVAIEEYPDPEPGTFSDPEDYRTYMLEAAIPWTYLGGYSGAIGLHLTSQCGNDSINIDPHTTQQIPAPGALALGSLGLSLVGWLRRRRGLLRD